MDSNRVINRENTKDVYSRTERLMEREMEREKGRERKMQEQIYYERKRLSVPTEGTIKRPLSGFIDLRDRKSVV